MDILPLHIEYLLTRHDCVILPGLGAFIATETEAYIDFEGGIIRPRRREISFNSSVVTDDGLLAHSIARRESIPYEDARRTLSLLMERLTADLDKEGEVSVGMVGKLVKDAEGLVSFRPRMSVMLSDVLTDLHLTAAKNDSIEATEEKDSDSAESLHEEDGMRTIRVRPDRYVFTVSKRAVHAAAMVIAVLTIGLSLLVPINHDNEQKASVISIEDFFHHSIRQEAFDNFKKDSASVNVEETDSLAITEHSKTL